MRSAESARAAALAAAFLLAGCIFGPDDGDKPKEPTPDFRPLTDKENVVHNLLESYEWADIEKYVDLMHADYVWRNRDDDIIEGKVPSEFYTREQDSASTHNLFKARLGTHPDPMVVAKTLRLAIHPAAWQEVAELFGDPCEDCWETARLYEIIVEMETKTLYATGTVKFVVVPVAEGGATHYKLRRADDLVD